MWKVESDIFWLAGFWKVTFGKWKVTFGNWKVECDFWKVKNIFWYHMFVCAVHYSMTRVITLWSPTRAPILSKNLNFLFKPAQIFPQYYDIVVISSKNWKIHWKIHLKKKHKILEKSHWLAGSNIFGKWKVECGKWNVESEIFQYGK